MALVNVTNVVVLDNPCKFNNPFKFEVTFECLQELEDDLEWRVVYVGSAESATGDQTLEEVMVGPVPPGVNKFVLEAKHPDPAKLPGGGGGGEGLLGVTVVLVTCAYRDAEFLRVGYYVNNEYEFPPEALAAAEARYQEALAQWEAGRQAPGGAGGARGEGEEEEEEEEEEEGEDKEGEAARRAAPQASSAPMPQPADFMPSPPTPLDLSRVVRNILNGEPRVTRFPIDWAPRGGAPIGGGATGGDSLMSFKSDNNDSLMDTAS